MKILKFLVVIILANLLVNTSYAYNESIIPVANPSGYGYGYNNVFEGKGAFEREFVFEYGEKVKGYSLSFNEPVNMNSDNYFAVTPYKDIEYSSIKQIGFLARNFNNIGESLVDLKSESVARQIAIWSLSGSFELFKLKELNFPIMKRAEELINLSRGKEFNNLGSTYNVTADIKNNKSVYIKIKYNNQPINNLDVSILRNNKETNVYKTNADGDIIIDLDPNFKENDISYSFSALIPGGSVLIGSNGGSIITTNENSIKVSGSMSFKSENNSKIIKKNSPIKKSIERLNAIEVSEKDIISYVENGNFKIVDTSDSKSFEKKHIVDSVNYFIGSNLPIEHIEKNSKILIIGNNKEDISNVKDYLILEKFTLVHYYIGNYDNIFDGIKESLIINDSSLTDDPSNAVIVFDDNIIESSNEKERSNPILLLLGILLLILSIIASLIRVRTSKK